MASETTDPESEAEATSAEHDTAEPEAVEPELGETDDGVTEDEEGEPVQTDEIVASATPDHPTRDDVDALIGPATPHFAYQLRARVAELVQNLPEDDDVRRYAEARMELLDRLGHASSKAVEGPHESSSRLGWDAIPSAATASEPLPQRGQ
jgi:hypothetical protein